MKIEIQNISKEFGTHVALDNLNFTIEEGNLTSLLGPSGCGKTTLLRIISGLEYASTGRILIDEQELNPTLQQKIGFVFQHYALFKHMTAFENVAFGLRVKPKKERPSKTEIESRVHEVLSLVQLDNQSHKYPHQLSGGQQQRIALARALVIKPKILLLDEPFGALDATVRRDLRRWLKRLHGEIHITTILVTHDQEEALEISDKIALLNQGKLEQYGNPKEIYTSPETPFVYEFLGEVNIFSGRLKDHHLIHFYQDQDNKYNTTYLNTDALVYVRPQDIKIYKQKEQETDLEAIIIQISFIGTNIRLEARLKGNAEYENYIIEASVPEKEWETNQYRVGDTIYLRTTQFKIFEEHEVKKSIKNTHTLSRAHTPNSKNLRKTSSKKQFSSKA